MSVQDGEDTAVMRYTRRSVMTWLLEAGVVLQLSTESCLAKQPGRPLMSSDHVNQIPLYKTQFAAFRNKTLEQKVQELADREEIRELISRYAHCVAHGVSVANLFTDDGVYIVRRPGHAAVEKRGRKQLDENFAQLETLVDRPLPMIHNYLIVISNDQAIGMCSNELRITENGKSIIASGYYEDKLRRENGQWRFTVRDATFIHWVPIQEGWVTTAQP